MISTDIQILTWVMTSVGFTGFLFAGKRKWWAWYINLACQILWGTYALATGQLAFLAFAVAYFAIFAVNAYKWTKDHLNVKRILKTMDETESGTFDMPGGVTVTYEHVKPTVNEAVEEHFEKAEAKQDDMPDVDLAARTCHEANRILQMFNGEEPSLPWHLASKWQKDSAIEGVLKALDGETAEELHISWCRSKIADGWTWGPFKDESIKTHPCLIPYAELPEIQRVKDHMFRAIVKSFKLEKQYANVSK